MRIFPHVVLVAASVAAFACSKPDAGAGATGSSSSTSTSPAAPGATSGGACDVVTCANFSGSPGYVAGKSEALPGMPTPPSGSTLCGATETFHSNYYTTTQSPDQIVAYYEKELPAHGFTMKPRKPGSRACSLELSFRKGTLQIGNITAFVGGYGVLYAGK